MADSLPWSYSNSSMLLSQPFIVILALLSLRGRASSDVGCVVG